MNASRMEMDQTVTASDKIASGCRQTPSLNEQQREFV
jgi:hypothetical protein